MQDVPNLSYIKELSDGDAAFEEKFIRILKEEFPEEAQTYRVHIQKDEPRMAAEIVHKLKHKFNILSMTNAYTFAVAYEEKLRAGDAQSDAGFCTILDTIENYLNTL